MAKMNDSGNAKPVVDEKRVGEVREAIEKRVRREFGVTAKAAAMPQIFQAAALCVRDEVMDAFADERERSQKSGDKCLVYLCAEFLIGRAFSNNLVNLNLYDTYVAALAEMGYELVYPAGAFYLLCRAPEGDGDAFSARAREQNLLVVSGAGFGAPAYVRIAYCVSRETVLRSLPIFRRLMEEGR